MPQGLLDTRDLRVLNTSLAELTPAELTALYATVEAIRASYNALMDDMIGRFSWKTTDHQMLWGNEAHGRMRRVDPNYARIDAQIIGVAGYTIGWPLRTYQASVAWTREYFALKTVDEFLRHFNSIRVADQEMIITEFKDTLFSPLNYTFRDERWGDLACKALFNADGAYIPPFNGQTFNGATHTHYLTSGAALITEANLLTIQNHLAEHGYAGPFVLWINIAQEGTIRGFPNFVGTQRPFIVDPTAVYATVSGDEGAIGRIFDFEVRVRNWMPPGYLLAYKESGNNSDQNPLVYRISPVASWQGLYMPGDEERFPLRQQWLERRFGFGVRNRANGVIMQQTVSASYTKPTIQLWYP